MSFQVQPAPRMAKAPMKNSTSSHGSAATSRAIPAASAADHQHGSSSSHEPIGRSKRARRRYGRDHAGARESTQLPVESATRPLASLIAVAMPTQRDQRESTLPLMVSKVLPPLLRTERTSLGTFDVPSTSLKEGGAAGPPPPPACAVAAWQTCFIICCERD